MDEPTKRDLRREKRDLKKAGSKRVRRQLKQGLVDDPDEAPHADIDYGRFSSTPYNGLDKDATRRRYRSQAEGSDG